MAEGKILFYQDTERSVFKFVGEIRHTLCSGFDTALNQSFKKNIKTYIIDLINAIYLDSTSLGLIAKIARFTHLHHYPKPTIFSTNENVNMILQSMGFDDIFVIRDANAESIDGLVAVEQRTMNKQETHKMVLEAHKILMDLNEKNKEAFQNVVDLLSANNE
ncbi:STAS domain-containing protein [candidate division KSB1 bacterium]|nr:STAS domain-containing protein [candidate division KSB1 bacterium]